MGPSNMGPSNIGKAVGPLVIRLYFSISMNANLRDLADDGYRYDRYQERLWWRRLVSVEALLVIVAIGGYVLYGGGLSGGDISIDLDLPATK